LRSPCGLVSCCKTYQGPAVTAEAAGSSPVVPPFSLKSSPHFPVSISLLTRAIPADPVGALKHKFKEPQRLSRRCGRLSAPPRLRLPALEEKRLRAVVA